MSLIKPNFSVNEYDHDGDLVEYGIYLHFGDVRLKVADSLSEFKEIIPHLEKIAREIEGNI